MPSALGHIRQSTRAHVITYTCEHLRCKTERGQKELATKSSDIKNQGQEVCEAETKAKKFPVYYSKAHT